MADGHALSAQVYFAIDLMPEIRALCGQHHLHLELAFAFKTLLAYDALNFLLRRDPHNLRSDMLNRSFSKALPHFPLLLGLGGAPKEETTGAPFGFSFLGFRFSRLPFCSRFAITASFAFAFV
jgi:hypothetical protein